MVLRQCVSARYFCTRMSNRIHRVKATSQRFLSTTSLQKSENGQTLEPSVLLSQNRLLSSKITVYARSQMEETSRIEEKRKIVQDLNKYLKLEGVEFSLISFGSSASGFGMKDSDLDMCMVIDPSVDKFGKNTTKKLLNSIGRAIRRYVKKGGQVENIELVQSAKVPIAKFDVRGISCDISFNNMIGVR